QDILNHEVFGRVLLQKLGCQHYEKLRHRFCDLPSSKDGYTNITSAFDKQVLHGYETSNEHSFNAKPTPKAISENRFNTKMFLIECSLTLFPQNLRTKANIQVIEDLASLYNIPVDTMCTYVGKASRVDLLSNAGTIDLELLKGYVMNNSHSIALEKDPYASSPILFLKSLQDNREPTTTEKRWISALVTEQRLNYAVINVLLEYVLKLKNGQLNRAFVETIAATWARQNIETKEQALKELKDYNPKVKTQTKTKSVQSDFSVQPDSLSVDEVKELKERLKRVGK
ncbi:MAG: DnaD domain protein, partial [Erysipelotrichaceae bacterium]